MREHPLNPLLGQQILFFKSTRLITRCNLAGRFYLKSQRNNKKLILFELFSKFIALVIYLNINLSIIY